MPPYRWIVFDADGTLFDYDRAELSALMRTFQAHGLVFDSEVHEAFIQINARMWRDFEKGLVSSLHLRVRRFEELAATRGLDLVPADFSIDYLKNLGAQSFLLPGAEEIVRSLSQRCGLVLATNGIAEVQRARFRASTLKPYFDAVVISDEIGVAKPDPRFFSILFSRIGEPEKPDVLMVGDGLSSDIQGGVNFGIDTCWFNPRGIENTSSTTPTCEISELGALVGISCGCMTTRRGDNLPADV